jgi:error-prone DNA polymerase
MYFLLIEDEAGLLQATIFEGIYRRYSHMVQQETAFLLKNKVEQDRREASPTLWSECRTCRRRSR